MCRIDGPFKNRNKFRVRVVDRETGLSKSYIYDTEALALEAIPKLRRQYERVIGVQVSKAITEYTTHLRVKELRPRTIETAIGRLKAFFQDDETITGALTQSSCSARWAALEGRKLSTAHRVGILKQVKRFLAWCHGKTWTKIEDLLAGVEVIGRVKKGKPQLTEDQSKAFLTLAIKRGYAGDEGAIAAACLLLLGLRASEVVERVVSDLDAGGTKLLITSAKTEAGIRTVVVPEVLRPLLAIMARGKGHQDRLLGLPTRHHILRAVRRLCKLAGVPLVPAHGLRGTHARIAVQAGVSGEAVARSLGHESFEVTREHYAGTQVVADVAANRVASALVPALSPAENHIALPT